ncbi:hypothetical protein AncyloWKF20_14210 [Ancylobacter sp. WKF20]|uniref:hypothetical protein n=1 Tax=Ancylobacter sp. WKF20 TaxID=3039801 RepID=UPI002434347A|nr:hypothetical protein [Ancylobacter sp. WKF20]WGD28935.1 hypothetical protein AncyloWKF20_14210 [Ancylobacter sp. WKF20]
MTRQDHVSEVVQRRNAIVRSNVQEIIIGELDADGRNALVEALPNRRVRHVSRGDIPSLFMSNNDKSRRKLVWGRDNIGVGLLKALYEKEIIDFTDKVSPSYSVKPKSNHLVICEAGEPLSEIIAANYAFSLGAGLHIINKVDDAECEEMLEAYYSIDDPNKNPTELRSRLGSRLREMCGDVELPAGGSLTFISRSLPFGVAFPELPSTHLFSYPALGVSIANGFAAEREGARGTNIAVLVDPEQVSAPEIKTAATLLSGRRIFVRGYSGQVATVRNISDMVEYFPYDILIISTHCGDASGHRWTYNFQDSDGYERELVVDIAIGLSDTDETNIVKVHQFMRFHSLDGIDWTDSEAKKNYNVGNAIVDFMSLIEADAIKPVRKDSVSRVVGSAAMRMADHNYLALHRSLASTGTPIIINNACVSWHELAQRLTFAGARVYVGTLFPVTDAEAEAVAVQLLGKQFGKMMPHALWAAQSAVYGNSNRRPYVITGVYPQRLRVTPEPVPQRILAELTRASKLWNLADSGDASGQEARRTSEAVRDFYQREITRIRDRWLSADDEA